MELALTLKTATYLANLTKTVMLLLLAVVKDSACTKLGVMALKVMETIVT